MVTITLPKEYGCVVLTAFSGVVVLFYKAMRVGMARKKYNVPVSENSISLLDGLLIDIGWIVVTLADPI